MKGNQNIRQTEQLLYNRLKRLEVFSLEIRSLKGHKTMVYKTRRMTEKMNNHQKPHLITMRHLKVIENKFKADQEHVYISGSGLLELAATGGCWKQVTTAGSRMN